MKTIWVLGSSNIDLISQVDAMPMAGNTIGSRSLSQSTGGKGANQAYAAAYWGGAVKFIGAVGDDENGKILLQQFANGGIDATHVHIVQDSPSGSAIVLVNAQGENCIIVNAGANHAIPPDVFDQVGSRPGDILIAQLEVNFDAVERSFASARHQDVITVLNPSPMAPLRDQKVRRTLLQHTDILIANSHEASELGGVDIRDRITAEKCARKLVDAGLQKVVVTLGRIGSMVMSARETHFVEAIDVNVVDTQGAGDAFLGAFIARMAMEDDLRACLKLPMLCLHTVSVGTALLKFRYHQRMSRP